MCRWFAYISGSEPCLLEDVLIRPDHSIVKQVESHYLPGLFASYKDSGDVKDPNEDKESEAKNPSESETPEKSKKETNKEIQEDMKRRNIFFNGDGTGVAFYSNVAKQFGQADIPLPQVYKTITPPTNDINFKSLCKNTSSKTVFAHVRMATSQVQQFNSHPFAFGRHIFMHNGGIAYFNDIRRDLCSKLSTAAYGNVQGSTDSEHLAALYMTYLVKNRRDAGEEVPEDEKKAWDLDYSLKERKVALERAITEVIKLQIQFLGNGPDVPTTMERSSLNLCTTDGLKLLAFRFRNCKKDEQPPSLYYSTLAGVTLNRKYVWHPNFLNNQDPGRFAAGLVGDSALPPERHGDHIIVSSEPTTRDKSNNQWTLVKENHAVMVEFTPNGKRVFNEEKINVNYPV